MWPWRQPSGQGWDEIVGPDGAFVGMTSFGASAPYKDLYRHFGITAEAAPRQHWTGSSGRWNPAAQALIMRHARPAGEG